MLYIRYLIYNPKRTFIMFLNVALSVILLLSILLIFASIHNYMVRVSLKEKPYHVSFNSINFEKPSYVKQLSYENNKVYIKYKSIFKTYKYTKKICNKITCKHISYNNKLLSLYGISTNKTLINTFKTILIFTLIIIGIGIIILISNSIRITLIERKKQIGILKSLGMTKIKLIQNTLLEGTVTLIIGLLIGILISLWITQLLLFIINNLIFEIFKTKFLLILYPHIILLALLYIIFIFYLACYMPIYKISKLNIIEIINGKDNFTLKKMPKYLYKLNPLNRISFANYYRIKKKYRAVKLCVFMSTILYITFSLYLTYSTKGINKTIDMPKYDFSATITGNDENIKKIKKLKYQKIAIYKTCMRIGKIDKNLYLSKKDYSDKKNILIIDHKKEGIINKVKENKNMEIIERKYLKDNIKLKIKDNKKIETIYNVPFGIESMLLQDNIVFLTNHFNNYCSNYNISIFIKNKSNHILKDIQKLKIKSEINYIDVKKANKFTNNLILTIKLGLYSILLLIIIIGISSICSTFALSLHLRKNELGILKSIGFTNKKLKNMLFKESLIILFKTFLYIIPISFFISYILYQSINDLIDMKMILPVKELIISFCVSLFIIYYTLNSNYKKINKQKLTDMFFSINS